MKMNKGLAICALTGLLLGSCFDPPEYSNVPQIEFKDIEFAEVGDFSDADTLILTFDFKDGDGDLGIGQNEFDFPFHETNYFVGQGTERIAVSARVFSDFTGLRYASNGETPTSPTTVIDSAPAGAGKFLTLADRPIYNLPPFVAPYTCPAYYQAYVTSTIFVRAQDVDAIPEANLVDTLVDANNRPVLYVAEGTWYIEANPNHYNITVKFFEKQADGSFDEFDFREVYCTTFDGRIPLLNSSDDGRTLEGTMKYRMESTGFLSTFSVKTLKLEIQVQDKAFNRSNVISTGEFTLNDIRR